MPHSTIEETTADPPPILRPLPRRPFELSPTDSFPSTPHNERSNSNPNLELTNGTSTPSRSRSILNLTSSTLFGIYSPTTEDNHIGTSVPPTPWGTGAETPRGRNGSVDSQSIRSSLAGLQLDGSRSQTGPGRPTSRSKGTGAGLKHRQPSRWSVIATVVGSTAVLFGFGVAYGVIISHLRDNRHFAPVRVEGIDRNSKIYLAFWGLAGVWMGNMLPWVDSVWETRTVPSSPLVNGVREKFTPENERAKGMVDEDAPARGDWSQIVRSIGAFVGIAFAIRRLPWKSTLQLSLSLSLVNPALWYLLDRSTTGLLLSTAIGVLGTFILLIINPALVPSPTVPRGNATVVYAHPGLGKGGKGLGMGVGVGYEGVAMAVWLGSVLFCSCVCFGNIGRRVAVIGRGVGRESGRGYGVGDRG